MSKKLLYRIIEILSVVLTLSFIALLMFTWTVIRENSTVSLYDKVITFITLLLASFTIGQIVGTIAIKIKDAVN